MKNHDKMPSRVPFQRRICNVIPYSVPTFAKKHDEVPTTVSFQWKIHDVVPHMVPMHAKKHDKVPSRVCFQWKMQYSALLASIHVRKEDEVLSRVWLCDEVPFRIPCLQENMMKYSLEWPPNGEYVMQCPIALPYLQGNTIKCPKCALPVEKMGMQCPTGFLYLMNCTLRWPLSEKIDLLPSRFSLKTKQTKTIAFYGASIVEKNMRQCPLCAP